MSASPTVRVPLGHSKLMVSPVGFGCWPIAGVSTLNVTDDLSIATMHAAIDSGINFFDTAFSYGYDGEADKLLSKVLESRRDEVVLASKTGQYLSNQQTRVIDGRPDAILRQTQLILDRLGVEQLDIMYLHVPDPSVPIDESADAIGETIRRGWARYAGVSNVNPEQLSTFHRVCPVTVVQPPFNMLQQDAVVELRTICRVEKISIACYWALMKGLLAGKLQRDHEFDPRDKRLTYPIFQGEAWNRSQDFLDKLRNLARDLECTVAQLVVAWTIRQAGVDVALCGAKRPEQIEETAAAMELQLTSDSLERIDGWIADYQSADTT